jgi:hypothetical protein
LQQGAIPNQIIPCPRPQSPSFSSPPPPPVSVPITPRAPANSSGASGPPPAPPPQQKKMSVNQGLCQNLTNSANTCLARMRIAASGQGSAFQDCLNMACEQMVKAGCTLSNVCTYGVSSTQPPVTCGVGQHLFFPKGYYGNAICQDNAPKDTPIGPPPDQSTITGNPPRRQ